MMISVAEQDRDVLMFLGWTILQGMHLLRFARDLATQLYRTRPNIHYILPRRHPITSLIIRDAHKRVQHNGIKETLTEVRTKYWIVKAQSLVRSIISTTGSSAANKTWIFLFTCCVVPAVHLDIVTDM